MQLLKNAVRHSDAVLAYAATYWPKDGICVGYIDGSTKFCRNPFASRLTEVVAKPADHAVLQSAAQSSTYRVPIKPASHFLAADFDGSLYEQALHTSTRLCKHASTYLPKFSGYCLCALRSLHFWDGPHWSPSAVSAAMLTHCTKIRGFIAQDYESLRRDKRHREWRTEKQFLQQLRIQTPYSLGKNSRATSRDGRLEISLPPKRAAPI